jgi:hypothetical protein
MRTLFAALLLTLAVPALADTAIVSPGGGKTSEWTVSNAAGGSTFTALSGRRAIELQNLGPNAIYCTVDGQAPLATGALGRKIDAGATWSLTAADTVTIKCIAASAAQVTTAATQVTELK